MKRTQYHKDFFYLYNLDGATANVTRSDKRVTKCHFGHSELLIPTESTMKELQLDMGFKTAHDAKVIDR